MRINKFKIKYKLQSNPKYEILQQVALLGGSTVNKYTSVHVKQLHFVICLICQFYPSITPRQTIGP